MAVQQTRYTYPSVLWKPVQLTFGVAPAVQLSGVYDSSEVRMYRYVGQDRGRMLISDYSPETEAWDQTISFDAFMRSQGFEFIESIVPTTVHSGRDHYIDIPTTAGNGYDVPGLYSDVWFLTSSSSGETAGPFIQYFRLESRTIANTQKLNAWYDLKLFPEGIPYPAASDNSWFPMAVGVIPSWQNIRDPSNFFTFKQWLSGIHVELTEVYFVEDEALGPLSPEIFVWSGSVVFGEQINNIFYGYVDPVLFGAAGKYSLHFRVKSDIGDDYRDFWKVITSSRAKKPEIDPSSNLCFPPATDNANVKTLCSMVVAYDGQGKELRRVSESSLSIMHEPHRSSSEMTNGGGSSGSTPLVRSFIALKATDILAASVWGNLSHDISSSSFDPLVVANDGFKMLEDVRDGTVSDGPGFYDFTSRSVQFDSSLIPIRYRTILAETRVPQDQVQYLGSVKTLNFSYADATVSGSTYRWPYTSPGGDGYFKLGFVTETNAVPSPVSAMLTFIAFAYITDGFFYVNKSMVDDVVPIVLGERKFIVTTYHSVSPRNSTTSPARIVCEKFRNEAATFRLGRPTNLSKFPVLCFYGTRPLVPGRDFNVLNNNTVEPLYTPVAGTRLTVYYGASS